MAKNEHGIELPPMLGLKLNTAMYEGNITFVFMLIADYLKSNDLRVPAQIATLYETEGLYEKE